MDRHASLRAVLPAFCVNSRWFLYKAELLRSVWITIGRELANRCCSFYTSSPVWIGLLFKVCDFDAVSLSCWRHEGHDDSTTAGVLEFSHTIFPLTHRMYQRCCATYESASLRMFRLGRTDTIRSASSASAAFVKAFDNSSKQVWIEGRFWQPLFVVTAPVLTVTKVTMQTLWYVLLGTMLVIQQSGSQRTYTFQKKMKLQSGDEYWGTVIL